MKIKGNETAGIKNKITERRTRRGDHGQDMLGKTLSLKEGDSEEQHTHETLTEGCTGRVATRNPEKSQEDDAKKLE